MSPTAPTFSTVEVARFAGTDRHTILAWDRRGVLSPSNRIRGERRYTVRDMAAALIARTSREIGFSPEIVNRIVELVQEADHGKLERAQLVTYRSETPGFMRHAFVDSWDTKHRQTFDVLEAAGEVIDRTSLRTVVDAVLAKIAERHSEAAMASTRREAE
jgi:DNA-binding transcriptional MerR regulator